MGISKDVQFYSFIQTLTHDLFHNELFLVLCSTLAGTTHTLTTHMTLVGKKNFFPAINGPLI